MYIIVLCYKFGSFSYPTIYSVCGRFNIMRIWFAADDENFRCPLLASQTFDSKT